MPRPVGEALEDKDAVGGLGLAGGHHTGDGDALIIRKPCRAALLGKILQNGADGRSVQLPHDVPVGIHGMTGEIEARSRFLHRHQLLGGVLRNIRQGRFLHSACGSSPGRHGEEVHLALQVLPLLGSNGIHHRLIDLDELRPSGPGGVKGSRPDEVLHRPLVHVAARHPAAKITEGRKRAALPLPHDRLDEAPADVLDGHQAEADAALLHGKAVLGAVDVRWQQGDAAVLALVDIARHFVGVVQHAGQQRRHVLLRVVAFEVRRLVGHHRVGNGVGLVESVVGKIDDLIAQVPDSALGMKEKLTDIGRKCQRKLEAPPTTL